MGVFARKALRAWLGLDPLACRSEAQIWVYWSMWELRRRRLMMRRANMVRAANF